MSQKMNRRQSDPKRSPQARRETVERKAARKFAKINGRKY